MTYRSVIVLGCWLSFTLMSNAQAPAPQAPAPPVSVSSINELNQILGNLQQTSQSILTDLGHLRTEKWKADSGTKKQTASDVESIQRNLQNALPAILNELKASPENVAQTFKTYRNLDALFDVVSSVVESAGAFGSKDEFQPLNRDLGALQDSRKAVADRMDRIALAKETELGQLRVALVNARAEAAPKKNVVDDTVPPPRKPAARKKPAAKPASPNSQTPPATTTPQQH